MEVGQRLVASSTNWAETPPDPNEGGRVWAILGAEPRSGFRRSSSLLRLLSRSRAGLGSEAAGRLPRAAVETWTRTVTSSDIKRAHTPEAESGEVFPGAVLRSRSRRTAAPRCGCSSAKRGTGAAPSSRQDRIESTSTSPSPSQTSTAGAYRTGCSPLRRSATANGSAFRPAVFSGVWKRK